jgi:hypothetical protein
MVEELLEELAGAVMFFKSDLGSGYYQIRMAPGEKFKITFRTHSNHYEFLVISFRLPNPLATF